MEKLKVYVTRRIPEAGLKKLHGLFDVKVHEGQMPPAREELLENVKGVDGLLCLLTDKIDAEVMDAAGKQLRVISNYAVGYNNIDVKAASERGILVTNTPGVLTETTADLAWALLMAISRRIVEADKYLRAGKWKTWEPQLLLGTDIYGKTLGVIGMGRIGTAVARRAKGFNMKILTASTEADRKNADEVGAEMVPLEQLLRESDFITVHVPLMPETTKMLGEKQFAMMKPTAYLINDARGEIIDEQALVKALKEKRIAGAALDVYEKEPIGADNPLVGLDNVVIVPHIGSASRETRDKMAEMAAENVLTALTGKPVPNPVNPEVMKK
ncbi:MAG: D-glycerate dehydrogenase [Candidatus Burarchaeum sp.]|nr:D-glycerate dehydrogenase [Candidatus Burarchaeum sp.]MDO8339951.1 D-glycerate dehydrogenase [Candidatus Burarchaeum sp.]